MTKNILIIASTSELAQDTIRELKNKDYKIFTTSRTVGLIEKEVFEYQLDIEKEEDFIALRDKIDKEKFDIILNFAGIAICSPVEELTELNLKKQLDVNLFGLLRVIKYICPFLKEDGKLINVSSMASYGIFPFLSPYCISKAAADILLQIFSIETNRKTVSIRPGAIATKFWDSSIELNKHCLNNEKEKYQKEKEFLIENAQRNALKATNPIYVAKKIVEIIEKKNPKMVYNIGLDSKFAKLTRFISQDLTVKLVRFVLKQRLSKKK